MRRLCIFILTSSLLLLVSCSQQSRKEGTVAAADSAYIAKAYVEPPRKSDTFVPQDTLFDFGEVHDVVIHSFVLVNKGGSPVVIDTVKSHCGCVTTAYEKTPVMPGQRRELMVTFTPLTKRGAFFKTIRIILNGGKEYTEVQVKGTIRRE